MANNDDLASLSTLAEALERLPNGLEAMNLMTRLGLWTAESHLRPAEREPFPSRLSDLAPEQLSDLSAGFIGDVGRALELCGLLLGLEAQLKIRAKDVRATARGRIRREWPPGRKAPTRTELDDLAEEDPAVIEADEQMALLVLLLAQATAVREANLLYADGIRQAFAHHNSQRVPSSSEQAISARRAEFGQDERDPMGGPGVMRLSVGSWWPTRWRTRLG